MLAAVADVVAEVRELSLMCMLFLRVPELGNYSACAFACRLFNALT